MSFRDVMSGRPDALTCRAAIDVLLHGLAQEQRAHATAFLLDELERIYSSSRQLPPTWINGLRAMQTGKIE
ncbi:MAG TPA: hypothetical protein VE871_14115 [Longimicrobium sp.]|nr:hypothetical protein [Longimicrobium sp.]